MQLCVFNGSPRGRKGNTSIILEHFLRGFSTNPENSVETYYLNRVKETETHVNAFRDAEAVLLAHPLYTDAMPALVKAFVEELQPLIGRETNPPIGFLVQSGFVEAAHSRHVERYWEKFSKRMGSRYLGTMIRGGCEPMHRDQSKFKKVLEGFYELGENFGQMGVFNDEMIRKMAGPEQLGAFTSAIVKLVWRLLGNPYWDDWMKEHEALEESFAQPYTE